MKVAIIGAGFTGLAVAWHLLQKYPNSKVTIFDAKGLGGGASGIAAGLLHPFSGAHSKLNRMGREGMQASLELMEMASKAIHQSVYEHKPILRLALTENQYKDFTLCANKYPDDVQWLTPEKCQTLVPRCTWAPGLLIQNGFVVRSTYLDGLWQACLMKGAQFKIESITSLKQLSHFDLHIVAAGAYVHSLKECAHLPIKIVKGQILELRWPKELPPLTVSLNSQAYILMNENNQTCLVGATFEKNVINEKPDIEVAKAEILPKAIAMLNDLQDAEVMRCYAGLRSVTPDHLPLIEPLGLNQWAITGMGSKGLLYHALMAKNLIEKI